MTNERTETHGDVISRQAAIDATWKEPSYTDPINVLTEVRDRIKALPSTQSDKKDLIQKFHDYQVDWLKGHFDLEFEPQLEESIIRFLHDTANCFLIEMDRDRYGE